MTSATDETPVRALFASILELENVFRKVGRDARAAGEHERGLRADGAVAVLGVLADRASVILTGGAKDPDADAGGLRLIRGGRA